jgi:hypothetical protein
MGKCPMNQDRYFAEYENHLGRIIVLIKTRSFCQNRRFGCVHPRSQFLRIPKLTPSFAAKVVLEKHVSSLYFVSDSAMDWVLFWQGGESTLTALITRWQKGCRNHLFRHFH